MNSLIFIKVSHYILLGESAGCITFCICIIKEKCKARASLLAYRLVLGVWIFSKVFQFFAKLFKPLIGYF